MTERTHLNPEPAAPKAPGRAGRNLPAAIGVGVGLGALCLLSLFIWRTAFFYVVMVAIAIGMWEVIQAVSQRRIEVPLIPTMAGGLIVLATSWIAGPAAVAVAYAAACAAILVWRVGTGVLGAQRDVAGGVLTVSYVALLASFCMLLLREPDGARRVFVFLLVTVCSDVGGYVAGILFGKHPMAPSVSPKKSWEGFSGSVLACCIAGALSVHYALGGAIWVGVLFGVLAALTATVGDLCESVIKRDLGIKDMGNLLPGHGGLMDRLDSLLLVAPTAYVILTTLVPVAH